MYAIEPRYVQLRVQFTAQDLFGKKIFKNVRACQTVPWDIRDADIYDDTSLNGVNDFYRYCNKDVRLIEELLQKC